METQASDRLVIRDYPVALWVVGGVFLAAGVLLAFELDSGWIAGVGVGGVGALLALLPTVLTLTADRQRGTLTVQHQSLWRKSVKEYPLKDIASVVVEGSMGGRNSSCRLALGLASGTQVPLRSYYSSGYSTKAQKASRLSDFLGLADQETRPVFPLAGLGGSAAGQRMSAGEVQEGTTNGVTWQVSLSSQDAMAIKRWMSPDFRLPNQFVCLLQKPKGSPALGGKGGLGGMVTHLLYQEVFTLYGFGSDDLPGLSTSAPVQGLDSRLAAHFASLTSDQAGAQAVLNPWAVTPLIDWAERYPLKTVGSAGTAGQLVVLFSPQGLCLARLNGAAADQAEAFAQLGVDLVRAQGVAGPTA
jgi:hypothetical protein